MVPKLYTNDVSPSVRAVQMTAKAIGLELELKQISIVNKENLSAKYRKLNPQRTVPLLIDSDGFVIWDSHAIMAYLVSKYAKNDTLYPKDLKKRAIIDQRLHFESGVLFPNLQRIIRPLLENIKKTLDQEMIDGVTESYELLDIFLKNNKWIAGNDVTIADFSLIASVTSANILIPIDVKKYRRLANWLERAVLLPEYEANRKGLYILEHYLKCFLSPI